MKLEELIEMWKVDSGKLDLTDLANEAAKIPTLHSKYYEMFMLENLCLQKLEHDYRKLYKIKTEYYLGKLSDEEHDEYGWEHVQLKILRQDVDTYISADPDIVKLLLKNSMQKEKVDFLKEIINQLHSRGFLIRHAIDFLKWSNGMG